MSGETEETGERLERLGRVGRIGRRLRHVGGKDAVAEVSIFISQKLKCTFSKAGELNQIYWGRLQNKTVPEVYM